MQSHHASKRQGGFRQSVARPDAPRQQARPSRVCARLSNQVHSASRHRLEGGYFEASHLAAPAPDVRRLRWSHGLRLKPPFPLGDVVLGMLVELEHGRFEPLAKEIANSA